jgi:hypothetical protein
MLQEVQYLVIPVLSVNARKLVEATVNEDDKDRCQRSTTAEEGDTDINRNMDVDWGLVEQDAPVKGEKPFSAFQSAVLRDVASDFKPLAFVDLHTGARTLMTSWGYKNATDPDYADQLKLLNLISEKHCKDCKIGANSKTIGYPCSGEVIDHMYSTQGIKYSVLWELYNGQHGTKDCVKMFNPPDSEYKELADNWANALLTVGDYVKTNVTANERSSPPAIPPAAAAAAVWVK